MASFWVSGVVAARNGQPYIQLANDKGMIGQLSMSEARQVAMDILQMCSRTEADAILVKFFKKNDLPDGALGALLQDFRDFRHGLDMEKAERSSDPENPE